MKNTYVKPMILVNEELSEGVYAASGAVGGVGDESSSSGTGDGAGNGGTARVCGSIYMQGVFVSTDQGEKIYGGENVGARGCEGCPAAWGDHCAINEVNYDSDFRPWWEVAGRSPYDNANS